MGGIGPVPNRFLPHFESNEGGILSESLSEIFWHQGMLVSPKFISLWVLSPFSNPIRNRKQK